MKHYLVFSIPAFILILILAQSCNGGMQADSTGDKNANNSQEEYVLVWEEEFDYKGLPDTNNWIFDTEGNEAGWGNNEAQHYTYRDTANAYVSNGTLKIKAKKEEAEGKFYTSARLVSRPSWQYGRIEISAKVPDGRGTWSAIWMMPGGWFFNDGNWPDVGEIDLMEHVGHEIGVIHASAHSKDYQWQNNTQKTGTISIEGVSDTFNVYTLDWTSEYIKVYANDSLFFTYENEGLGESKWPFDKAFSLIMNIAVGGVWGSKNGIDESAFPHIMEIDYIRVYQPQNIASGE